MAVDVREVRLFRNNRSQALRIPVDFELPGDRARLRKDGHRLIIEPMAKASLMALLTEWEPLEEDFGDIADPPPTPEAPLR